jgi:hypothetical protein
VDSEQGRSECRNPNNHGTHFDLQIAAIAAYLGDAASLVAVFRRCRARIGLQFDPDGSQPHELRRTNSLHYCCFNLQGWIGLGTIGARCGEHLLQHRSAKGANILRGIDWLLALALGREWPYSQTHDFDWNRLAPLQDLVTAHPPGEAARILEAHRASPKHSPDHGIRPYWYL